MSAQFIETLDGGFIPVSRIAHVRPSRDGVNFIARDVDGDEWALSYEAYWPLASKDAHRDAFVPATPGETAIVVYLSASRDPEVFSAPVVGWRVRWIFDGDAWQKSSPVLAGLWGGEGEFPGDAVGIQRGDGKVYDLGGDRLHDTPAAFVEAVVKAAAEARGTKAGGIIVDTGVPQPTVTGAAS